MSIGFAVDLSALQREVREFADVHFPDRTLASVLAHLREEIDELAAEVGLPWVEEADGVAEELADCGLLLLSMASLVGEDLAGLMATKHVVNTGRRWTRQMDGYVKHEEDQP